MRADEPCGGGREGGREGGGGGDGWPREIASHLSSIRDFAGREDAIAFREGGREGGRERETR